MTEVPALEGSQAPRTGGANGRPQKSEGQVIAEAQRRAGIMAYGGENGGGVGGAAAAATGMPMGGGTGAQGEQLIGASADGDGQGGSRRKNLETIRQNTPLDRASGRHIEHREMLTQNGR